VNKCFSYTGVRFVPRIYTSVLYEADHIHIVKLLVLVSSLQQVLLSPAVSVVNVHKNVSGEVILVTQLF